MLLRALPVLVELGLLIYCLIDAIQTPADEVRNLPKAWWILLIVLVPIVGPVAWLVAGRPPRSAAPPRTTGFPEYERDRWAPQRGGGGRSPGRAAAVAPDDDPAFLAELRKVDEEHEATLHSWEQDLRAREAELRRRSDGPGPAGPA